MRLAISLYIQCVQKKRDQNVFVISSTKLWRFRWNSVDYFLNKFSAKICKHFPPHLNNVSTLPCETWNVHHAGTTTALSEKETPEFIPPRLWSPNSPDLNPVDYSVWEYCKRRCTKHAPLIWMNWNSNWERRGPSWIMSSLRQSIAADHCSVFYTPLLQYFPHAVINWIQIWRICRPQLRLDKLWCLSSNSIVARALWASQVSRGSVETLFRWSENICMMLRRIYSGNYVPSLSQLPKFYRRYYKKTFWSLDQCKKSTGNLLNVSWKSPGNLLGWICRHPVFPCHIHSWFKWYKNFQKKID